jgi:hypothetical protein
MSITDPTLALFFSYLGNAAIIAAGIFTLLVLISWPMVCATFFDWSEGVLISVYAAYFILFLLVVTYFTAAIKTGAIVLPAYLA